MNRSTNTKRTRDYMCYYCNAAGETIVKDFVFDTVDEVYAHWKSNHSNDITDADTDAANVKARGPFRFYPVDLLHCSMDNCRYYSTFKGLQRHHERKHEGAAFVPIKNGRCALCLYSGDGLREHSCSSLENGMQMKFYNPVLLTDQDLAELQSIECQQWKQDRPKQIECQHCGSIFATRQEMTQHHYQKHG